MSASLYQDSCRQLVNQPLCQSIQYVMSINLASRDNCSRNIAAGKLTSKINKALLSQWLMNKQITLKQQRLQNKPQSLKCPNIHHNLHMMRFLSFPSGGKKGLVLWKWPGDPVAIKHNWHVFFDAKCIYLVTRRKKIDLCTSEGWGMTKELWTRSVMKEI